VERVERVVRKALAKLEASTIEKIDTSVMARVIRSAKAPADIFVFIFSGVEFGE
jgi:hypothetical protein